MRKAMRKERTWRWSEGRLELHCPKGGWSPAFRVARESNWLYWTLGHFCQACGQFHYRRVPVIWIILWGIFHVCGVA